MPGSSFVHLDALTHRIEPDPAVAGGWTVGRRDLDAWLVEHGAVPLAGRVPVLTFGSNRCPSKLTWLREHLGLSGPVVVLRAAVTGLSAVWAAGLRARDGARPATLAVVAGAREEHAVWMATPEQVAVLDVCEGRGERYDLVRLHAGRVVTEDGAHLTDPWTYWPATAVRAPLLVDGAPVPVAEVGQDAARHLVGEAGAVPADAATRCVGAPDPASWPEHVFTYGTLQPGRRAWWRMAEHAVGDPEPAWMPGRVHDTPWGYPALRPAAWRPGDEGGAGRATSGWASGTLVRLADPAAAMPGLDAYEGPEYRRVRRVTYRSSGDRGGGTSPVSPDGLPVSPDGSPSGGVPAWVWVWERPVDGWPVVEGSWPARGRGTGT